MATIKLNFRENLAYVTDGSGEVAVIDGPSYPTTSGGVTFGVVSGGNLSRDRDSGTDPRLAGLLGNSSLATAITFQIDLGSSGAKNIRIACGDGAFDATLAQYLEVRDDTTTLITLTDGDGYSSGEYQDAGGTVRADDTAWLANNEQVAVTFSTTTCNIILGNGTDTQGLISHIEIDDSVGGSDPYTSSLNLLGVGA